MKRTKTRKIWPQLSAMLNSDVIQRYVPPVALHEFNTNLGKNVNKLFNVNLICMLIRFQNFQMPTLNDEDQACLTSCMDEIRNVVGDSVSERQLVDTIMKFKFDFAKSLDEILNNATTPPSKSAAHASTSKVPPIETGDTLNKIIINSNLNWFPFIFERQIHLFHMFSLFPFMFDRRVNHSIHTFIIVFLRKVRLES